MVGARARPSASPKSTRKVRAKTDMSTSRRPPGRPPDTNSASTRREMIEAARACFGSFGFDKTSNADIVEKAGVTTGPLYHHFGSKAGLYGAVANDSIAVLVGRLEDVVGARADEDVVSRLGAMLQAVAEIYIEDEDLARFDAIGPLELKRTPELVDHIDRSQRARLSALFDALIEDARDAQHVDPTSSDAALNDLITVLYFGLIYYCAVVDADARPFDVVEVIVKGLRGELFA